MKRAQLSVILGVVSALVLLVGVTAIYPSVDDLWVENPFWNGLSEFYSEVGPRRLGDLGALLSASPEGSTLFVVGPSTRWSREEVTYISYYLQAGGTVVLADDFGSGNQLLEGLGVAAKFTGGLLRDPLFRDGSSVMPVAMGTGYGGVERLVLNYGTSLEGVGEAEVRARSSPFSVLETGGGPVAGSWPLVAELDHGEGRLVLVSDSSLWINGMIGRGDNGALLEALLRGEAMVDEAHSEPSRLTVAKSLLAKAYTALGALELRYGLALLFVAGVMAVRLDGEGPLDEVGAVLAAHPEYDGALVGRLEAERRRARGG